MKRSLYLLAVSIFLTGCLSFSGYWDKSLGLVSERKYSEALTTMEHEVSKKPGDAVVRYRYALILHASGKYLEAASQADTSFALGLGETQARRDAEKAGFSVEAIYAEAGFQYLGKNLFEDAARCFVTAASVSGEASYYYNLAGFSMLEEENNVQAVVYLEKSLEADNLYEEARQNYCIALFRSGEYAKVTVFLKNYSSLKPAEYYMLGTSMLMSLDEESVLINSGEIATCLDFALEDTSSEIKASALYNRAMLEMMTGDKENALKCFSEATVLDSTSFLLYYNYGVVLMESGLYTQAKNIFTQAIAIDPYSPDAYTNRAICEEKLGESDNAKLDFIRGMELRKE